MRLLNIENTTHMRRLEVQDSDWEKLSVSDATRLMTLLLVARHFEEQILRMDKLNLIHGPAHSSIGQEGGAAGCIAALPRSVLINGTHRAHHQCLAKAINALYEDNFDPLKEGSLTAEMHAEIKSMLFEIVGLQGGWTGGRGGSMHLRRERLGIMGTNAIVAGGLPIACGHAFAEKVRGSQNIMVTFFGDGAVNQGATYEAMNLAALYHLPLLFFLENNHYAVSMSVEQSTYETQLLTRPQSLGIESILVDGMNPLAVWLGTQWCYEYILREGKPAFIQADVYRYYHQSSPIIGSAFGYRSREEEELWKSRDPGDFLHKELVKRGLLTEEELHTLDRIVKTAVNEAYDACVEGSGSSATIRPQLWPDVSTVDNELTSDYSELEGCFFAERDDFAPKDMRPMTYIEAISQVVGEYMSKDDTVYIFGEDVANMGGGTVGATKDLAKRFPGRVINTPISENGFCGLATGAAMSGLRTIVELMYSDFFLVAADQLLNQAGKIRHLFNGTATVPLVLRARVPGREGYGSQHSMDPAGVFALFPGWHIVAPSNAFDYVGLMNSALRCNDPVLVIEPQELHRHTTQVPKNLNYYIPLNKARLVSEGSEITLIATLTMVETAQNIVNELGVDADIIDLRTLAQRDIDYELIGRSLKKTGKVAILEQTTRGASIGSIIAAEIQYRFFDYLDQPVKRVTGNWAPPVVSKPLEAAALAQRSDVVDMVFELMRDSGLSIDT